VRVVDEFFVNVFWWFLYALPVLLVAAVATFFVMSFRLNRHLRSEERERRTQEAATRAAWMPSEPSRPAPGRTGDAGPGSH
jgi:apolipoprotein N-acyltransferase